MPSVSAWAPPSCVPHDSAGRAGACVFYPGDCALFSGACGVLGASWPWGRQALIMLGIVLLVRQVESHILQPLIMVRLYHCTRWP